MSAVCSIGEYALRSLHAGGLSLPINILLFWHHAPGGELEVRILAQRLCLAAVTRRIRGTESVWAISKL